MCLGHIGQGDAMCVARADQCLVESHKKHKFDWEDETSQFMIQKSDMSVFCTPSVPRANVSSNLEDWLLKTSFPMTLSVS